ncbi:MAG TPA: T9SS type A sorting domain-containing protein, partial [Cyclobacteriaceae bacterium]|nr:T9SS type A sorting domain-containing protein [Cyclobacteriaceae bacterium]
FDFFNSGTINQSGDFLDIDNGDTNIDNLSGGIWNWNFVQAAFDAEMTSVLNCSATGNTFNYGAAGNQRIIPVAYQNLNLSGSGAKNANNANFSVGGNWTVSGTASFTEGTGTVTFNGTGAQVITNPSGETFNNLTLNNTFATSPQITLNNAVTVTNILTMTDGNVNLNGNNFTLSSTAAGALAHGLNAANGWMYGGNIIRTRPASTAITVGTAHSFFPLGSATYWRPFFAGQSGHANTAGTITVSHTNSTITNDVTFPEGITRRHEAFWTVSTTGISAGPTFDLRTGGTNFGTIQEASDLRMSTSTGVVGTHAAATGGPDYRVNRTGVDFTDLANNYHVASTDAVNSPLPVELVNFSARVVPEGIQLDWTTDSELNNDFFTVERSANGEEFSGVGKVKGAGTTSKRNTYALTDVHPLNGKSYYRLKQTDFDGTYAYSSVIAVTYDGPSSMTMHIYPNPSHGKEITLELTGVGEAQYIPVVVYDQLGREYSRFVLRPDAQTGRVLHRLTFTELLPKGVYILKAGQAAYVTRRFVITD